MHQPFQKPENALRRADELEALGQSEAALTVLHSAIGHRRFRASGWDSVQERILLRYGKLCVDLEKLKFAREGLHQYRAVSQATNIASLGKVICDLRDRTEARLSNAKALLSDAELKSSMVEDLEGAETPEKIMLSTLHIDVRDSEGQKVYAALRFAWETYKMILDVLRTTPKLEKVYHETAQKAFQFCRDNERTQEFKRLCEVLRTHYIILQKLRGKPEAESLLRPEWHLETRLVQMSVAGELCLWKEACATAEDIHNLGFLDIFAHTLRAPVEQFPNARERMLKWVSIYYDRMAQLLWVSENNLFHALAELKYLLHIRSFKKTVGEEEMRDLCSRAVLAVIAIPRSSKEVGVLIAENQRKLTAMLGHPAVPCRDFLKMAVETKDILPHAHPVCRNLYALLEDQFVPLKLCTQSLPLLKELSELGPKMAKYVEPLKTIIFHRLVVQLSKVYKSLCVSHFTEKVCPEAFYPWAEAEKAMVNMVLEGQVDLRLDYSKECINFGVDMSQSAGLLRTQLSTTAARLFDVVQFVNDDDGEKSLPLFNNQGEKKLFNELLADRHSALKIRTKENDFKRQKKHAEQLRILEDRRKLQEQQRVSEQRAEVRRREEALKRREDNRMAEEKYKAKKETAQMMLDEIKTMSGNKVQIKGKLIDEIKVTDVLEGRVVYEDIEKAQDEQRLRACMERVKIRKGEAKRMDHFVRACREEEAGILGEWQNRTLEEDKLILEQLHQQLIQQKEEEKMMRLGAREALKDYAEAKRIFVQKQLTLQARTSQLPIAEAQRRRILQGYKNSKISRARQRLQSKVTATATVEPEF